MLSSKDGIGGSYRLASLDRLANRQRILEQNGGLGNVNLERNGNKNHENLNSNGHSTPATNGGGSTTPTSTTTVRTNELAQK